MALLLPDRVSSSPVLKLSIGMLALTLLHTILIPSRYVPLACFGDQICVVGGLCGGLDGGGLWLVFGMLVLVEGWIREVLFEKGVGEGRRER